MTEDSQLKKLEIEWESMNGGEIFMAHFPHPFPMSDGEYRAFENVFADWQRRQWEGIGETRVDETQGPKALVQALARLGYVIVNRGALPPGVLERVIR
jgi:hypothetical protein